MIIPLFFGTKLDNKSSSPQVRQVRTRNLYFKDFSLVLQFN
jgi:hypothetical protein